MLCARSFHKRASAPKLKTKTFLYSVYEKLLSTRIKESSERVILIIAMLSYAAHLLLIFLVSKDIIQLESYLLRSPIAALYTPFSFILVYEVYLLIFFLPKSITTYIGKQYEIITLIVVRRVFKDLAKLELSSDWFQNANDLQFTYDVMTSLVLFGLIFLFYRNNAKKDYSRINQPDAEGMKIRRFVNLKKGIATILVPILLGLAFFSFYHWLEESFIQPQHAILPLSNINKVFFDDFFTVLIVVDALLLLASLFYSDEFYKIIRNSGFIISTILIKMSFSVEGIVNNLLIIGAVVFGILILYIHDLYEKDAANHKMGEEEAQ